MGGMSATANTQFPPSHRHFLSFKSIALEGKGTKVGLLFRADADSFTHLTNIHKTPPVGLAVQLLGYRGKQDMAPSLRQQTVL